MVTCTTKLAPAHCLWPQLQTTCLASAGAWLKVAGDERVLWCRPWALPIVPGGPHHKLTGAEGLRPDAVEKILGCPPSWEIERQQT